MKDLSAVFDEQGRLLFKGSINEAQKQVEQSKGRVHLKMYFKFGKLISVNDYEYLNGRQIEHHLNYIPVNEVDILAEVRSPQ